MPAYYIFCGVLKNHSQYLNPNPELIHNRNIISVTTNLPIIEAHHIHDQVQQSQDRSMKISESIFFSEQMNNPEVIKIIDFITSDKPDLEYKTI